MILLDTHALVWWATEPAKLSVKAQRAAQKAATARVLDAKLITADDRLRAALKVETLW